MATIEVDDETKKSLEQVKIEYEKRWGKILWKDFIIWSLRENNNFFLYSTKIKKLSWRQSKMKGENERIRLLEKENQKLKDRIWFLSSSISVRDGDIEVLSKENRELKDEIFDFQKRKYLRIKGVPRII